jgi:hypothetical protein
MITGFIVLLILLVPSVFPKSSNCGVLHVAGKILSGSNDFNLISHAFVQTENELHYFRDVSSQEVAFVNKRFLIKIVNQMIFLVRKLQGNLSSNLSQNSWNSKQGKLETN